MSLNEFGKTEEEMSKVVLETDVTWDCIVIKPNKISQFDWRSPNYLNDILSIDAISIHKADKDTFIKLIDDSLEIQSYGKSGICIKTEVIGEEPNYLYEMMYIDWQVYKELRDENKTNELADLLNINGDKVYSPAIIIKNHIPSLTNSMNVCDVTIEDIKRILHKRHNTNIIIWDDNEEWKEIEFGGDIEGYAQKFFDGERFNKTEIGFLKHNLNIYWLEDEFGSCSVRNTCGKLLNKPVEKCIVFSIYADNIRHSLTLNEFNKILKLSDKLEDYKVPAKFNPDSELKDALGRKIVNNRFKILDSIYNDYFSN